MSAPVWEYSFFSKLKVWRMVWNGPHMLWPPDAQDLAEQVAVMARGGDPRTITVYVWKDGEYQGKFVVKPEIEVTWTATKEDEEE